MYDVFTLFTEYGEFKEKHNVGFFDMVKTPSMACEITMQVSKELKEKYNV